MPVRCGGCGRFAPVTYEWRGASYAEVIDCEHCPGGGYKYDPFYEAVAGKSEAELREEGIL
jgi:hypothetical protein